MTTKTNLEIAEEIAEKLRRQPYHLFKNDCLIKSIKFKKQCEAHGVPAHCVACIGLARARLFGGWFTIPVIHGWGEVEGKRIEVSRPIGTGGVWGIVPVYIKPVFAVWYK